VGAAACRALLLAAGCGALLLAAACGGSERGERAEVTSAVDAAAAAQPTPARPATDAGPRDVDASPIRAIDVLSGPQAEQAIARQISPRVDAGPTSGPPETAPSYPVSPQGAGPFRLGMTRADVTHLVPERSIVRLKTPAGQPSAEVATLFVHGAPLIRVRLFAARAVEIEVLQRDRRAATDGDVMVGSPFSEAVDAHGEPIRVRDAGGTARGWMMSELPGVVFAPADPRLLRHDQPPPGARIGKLVILGAESLAPPD
jgi:hypothetical protein